MFFFFFLTTFFTTTLFAELKKIRSIEIQGNRYVSKNEIREKIKLSKGDLLTEQALKEDIENIVSLGFFLEVNAETVEVEKGVKLIFNVKEKPQIKKIVFRGNKHFSDRKLKGEFSLKEKEFFDQKKLQEDIAKIVDLYKDKGYADCRVEGYETAEIENKVTVNIFITEGNQIVIQEIKFEGVKSFPPKKIFKLMKTKTKKVYQKEDLDNDLKEIESFYKNHGYLKMKLEAPMITFNPARTEMQITLQINEGTKFKVQEFEFMGNKILSEKELEKVVTLKKGKNFEQAKYEETLINLQTLYGDKGYLHASIEPEMIEDSEKGNLKIKFQINEGEVVNIERIYIEGNTSTKEYVFRRELLVQEGVPLLANKVRRSLERLYNLGFLDDVKVDVQQVKSPNLADLVFTISEGKPGMLSAGAGYSSTDRLVGTLQVQHKNLFGRAYQLNLLWEFGARKQNYDVSFTDPWFLQKPMSLGVDVFNTLTTKQYRTEESAYEEKREGGGLRLGPRLSDYLGLNFAYAYEKIGIFNIKEEYKYPTNPTGIKEETKVTSSLTSSINYDSRDNIFDPAHGTKDTFSIQLAGSLLGGNVNFYKPTLSSSWFLPTFWKFVLALNARVAFVEGINSTDVPVYERFFIGGADTVRAYAYGGEIGAKEGGKYMAVFNAEYRFPISMERGRTVVQGAIFYDLGGTWAERNDINFHIGTPENWMKSGIGFGIRMISPVFPLRFDWGYPLNKEKKEWQFYFSMGNIF